MAFDCFALCGSDFDGLCLQNQLTDGENVAAGINDHAVSFPFGAQYLCRGCTLRDGRFNFNHGIQNFFRCLLSPNRLTEANGDDDK